MTAPSGWPGIAIDRGHTLFPLDSIATTSCSTNPNLASVRKLINAALSHEMLVIGFGISCSHPTFA